MTPLFFLTSAPTARARLRARCVEPGFDKFQDSARPKNLKFVAMTQYEKIWPWLQYIIGPEKTRAHPCERVSPRCRYKNLRVAETEKYAHVTYFFNGGVEKPFWGEERVLVPSPKVPTYDLKPEMSAAGVADAVVHAVEKGDFDAIIMNFANADMVGHSGKARSGDQSLRNSGRVSRHEFFRLCVRAAARGSSPPIMAMRKR